MSCRRLMCFAHRQWMQCESRANEILYILLLLSAMSHSSCNWIRLKVKSMVRSSLRIISTIEMHWNRHTNPMKTKLTCERWACVRARVCAVCALEMHRLWLWRVGRAMSSANRIFDLELRPCVDYRDLSRLQFNFIDSSSVRFVSISVCVNKVRISILDSRFFIPRFDKKN